MLYRRHHARVTQATARREANPLDFRGQARREKEVARQTQLSEIRRRRDLISFQATAEGRRELRRMLADGGLHPGRDGVNSIFDRHHGQMSRDEEARNRALNTLWPLLRAVARDPSLYENFQLLMTETDQ